MKDKIKALFVIAALCGLFAQFTLSVSSAGEGIDVTVSILPQKYFVQKIAGDLLNTTVMVLPGANPATIRRDDR